MIDFKQIYYKSILKRILETGKKQRFFEKSKEERGERGVKMRQFMVWARVFLLRIVLAE